MPKRGRVGVLAAIAVTFVGIALAVFVVNGHRFPSMTRLPGPIGFKNVMVHDIAAMTALTGKNLVPSAGQASSGDDPVEYFRRIYEPRHTNIETANDREGRLWKVLDLPDAVVYSAFLSAVRNEPGAYIERRVAIFRDLVKRRAELDGILPANSAQGPEPVVRISLQFTEEQWNHLPPHSDNPLIRGMQNPIGY